MIGEGLFQAIGKPIPATILSLSRQVLLFLPALYLFPLLWEHLGSAPIEGVFWSFPASDLLSAAMATIFILWQFRKLKSGVDENSLIAQ
jgi:Na+-driven multidrug efflux pump